MQETSRGINYRSLTGKITYRGNGLHSGKECSLTIEPYDGLALGNGGQPLPIAQLGLEGSKRGSDLIFPDGTRVRTCEHVLSALTGCGVWNALLTVEGPEMPVFDGCAEQAAKWIMENSNPTDKGPAAFAPSFPLHTGDDSRFVAVFPAEKFYATYVIEYDTGIIGTQIMDYDGRDYLHELAPARTFAMASDIEALRAKGLALGGTLDNAIVVDGNEAHTTGGLRFPDEFVRHKMLDLLGDLALLGRPLCAHVIAVRAGHVQHLEMTERLRAVLGTEKSGPQIKK